MKNPIIIFDLEATCWPNIKTDESSELETLPSEIIEIGAVKLNTKHKIVSEFQAFVRPVIHPELSEFCTQLTTIQQTDVDAASPFPVVLPRFLEWAGPNAIYLSWGAYDRKMLELECQRAGLSFDWLKHINLKIYFSRHRGVQKQAGLSKALRVVGVPFQGTHHRAIADAQNTAIVFQWMQTHKAKPLADDIELLNDALKRLRDDQT